MIQEPCEFGFVHVKAVDDTGHDRRVQMKVSKACCVRMFFCAAVSVLIQVQMQWPCSRPWLSMCCLEHSSDKARCTKLFHMSFVPLS